ncbi:isoprenylcysteine carboxylmethyltransferase family protein [uncultured Treponema sp.]|uniref:methyltransferase family protein n=1 Tax=uncultured Treponema sp. TaxID=162155 RepID=UPI00280AA483|nr:isoprenylcysteine carboxylmethyltransferase family protein [uncultured Treponema sp.]
MRFAVLFVIAFFYSVYLGKMFVQRKKGIRTDQIAVGKKGTLFFTELLMKIATYSVVVSEIISIFVVRPILPMPLQIAGVLIGLLGDAVFLCAVLTMKDSWRAGISESDRTKIVTGGIYSASRNPAFLAFDLVYLGVLLVFFNVPLLAISAFAAVMLHLQILQEEKFLPTVFGDEYRNYKNHVFRYLGRRK